MTRGESIKAKPLKGGGAKPGLHSLKAGAARLPKSTRR